MHIINISNLNDDGLEVYTRLNENQLFHFNEPEPGLFIAESAKILERALDKGYEPISVLTTAKILGRDVCEIIKRCNDIPVYISDDKTLDKLTGFHLTGGVLCAMKRKSMPKPEELLRVSTRIVILESVMNPTNVGAIFRSAAALGMDAVLVTGSCADPLCRRSVRVSMGNVFQIPWTYIDVKNCDYPKESFAVLKEYGFKTAAMALKKESISISDNALKSTDKLAIFMGSEGYGLSDETIDLCDYVIKIPMHNNVDSLNVAAASALAFWELSK